MSARWNFLYWINVFHKNIFLLETCFEVSLSYEYIHFFRGLEVLEVYWNSERFHRLRHIIKLDGNKSVIIID